jgi:hypothetical protein
MKDDFLNKADEGKEMDDLFRQGLSGLRSEPSGSVWKGISRKLLWRELLNFNFKNLSRSLLIGGVVLVAVLSTVTYVNFKHSPADALNAQKMPVVLATSHNPQAAPPSVSRIKSDLSMQTDAGSQSMAVNESPSFNMPANKPLPAKTVSERVIETSQNAEISASAHNEGANNASAIRSNILSTISKLNPYDAELLPVNPSHDTLIIITPTETIKINREKKPITNFYSASLGISPEAIYYTSPETYSKVSFWVNTGFTWHISRFTLGTGLGLGYVNDEGKYKIDYLSNDSIGYYNGVVNYSIDPVTNQIVFNTQSYKVTDSIYHVADDRTRNRYTYLQIPLLFGYRLFESSRLSITLQAGPAVSFLVSTKEAEPDINYANARITLITSSSPARVTTTWQLWANFLIEYRLTKEVSLYLQPVYKYYLKPVAEKENVSYGQPWSIGLGVGLQFNFGHKKNDR